MTVILFALMVDTLLASHRSMEHCSWIRAARDMTSAAIPAQSTQHSAPAISSFGADHDGHACAVDTKLDCDERH